MSEDNLENYFSYLNFFDIYIHKWEELNKDDIVNIFSKIDISEIDLVNYIYDIDVRCHYEQKRRDEIYDKIIREGKTEYHELTNKQLCRLDINVLKFDKENLINYLLILSNLLKEKKKLSIILKNNN